MPFTLLAHQVPAIALKLARPRWFDGTALCVGSMGPDLGYSISSYLHVDTHEGWGVLVVAIPIAVVFTIAARVAASTVAAQLPDLGSFRLWSWRTLSTRWPAWWVTGYSVVIGVATHLLLDGFTHQGRWGPSLLGYEHIEWTMLGRRMGVASWLQYLGHSVGSMLAVLLMWHIGRRRCVDDWYGQPAVAQARSFHVTTRQRVAFWAIVMAGLVIGTAWGWHGDRVEQVLRPIVAMASAATLAHFVRAARITE